MRFKVAIGVLVLIGFNGRPALADAVYNFSGTCSGDCGPLGVLTTAVGTVTGSLRLSVPASPVVQPWNAANVLSYSFIFDSFQITNANSTLSNSIVGNNPFTTTATNPF